MAQILSPFKATASSKFKKIFVEGSPGLGHVYMLQTGGLAPLENPAEDQEKEKLLSDLNWIIISACRRVAAEVGISASQARKMLFDAPIKEAEPTEEAEADKNQDSLAVSVEKKEPLNADDYLTKEEFDAVRRIQSSQGDMIAQSTTKFMQYRMAYPLEPVVDVPSTSSPFTALILPAFFEAAKGSEFMVKGGILRLAKELKAGDREARFEAAVMPPSEKITANTPIFLKDSETGLEKVGCDSWSKEMTATIDYALQAAIRAFFKQEGAGLTDEDIERIAAEQRARLEATNQEEDDPSLGKLSNSSTPPEVERQRTGSKSTSDSNFSDAKTSDSTTKTLAVSPTG